MSKAYEKMILFFQLIPLLGAVLFVGLMVIDAIQYAKNGEEISDILSSIAMFGWLLTGLGVGTGTLGLIKTIGKSGEEVSLKRRIIIGLSLISLIIGVLGIGSFLWMMTQIQV